MKHLWLLTASTVLFGAGNGLAVVAMPQKGLALGFPSTHLGLVGACLPLGYALGCMSWGKVLGRFHAKGVACWGIAGAGLMFLAMTATASAAEFALAYFLYGLCCAAFWPLTSAWMLGFLSEQISKSRILRHYNVGWTSGTALGAFGGGFLFELPLGALEAADSVFFLAAALMVLNLVVACLAQRPDPAGEVVPHGTVRAEPLGWAILAAALSANLLVLAARSVVAVNYPELNELLGGEPRRMGLLVASTTAAQLLFFAAERFYAAYLGLRRTYVLAGLGLAATCLAFASSRSLAVLVCAAFVQGAVAAVFFQSAILAAVGYFATARRGTAFHEMIIGWGGLAPVAAGLLVSRLKAQGVGELAALRAPLLVLAALVLAGLALQWVLLTRRKGPRLLLPGGSVQGA